ncbi:MAG: GNAT family N-acetyltransferase [Spirochaetales bacterium]|nr:GNAT family N-acetyltransferase [Spirochaetales bacterium]
MLKRGRYNIKLKLIMERHYIIRDYKENDYQALVDLWNRTGLNTPGRGDDRQVINRTLSMGARLFILATDNAASGGNTLIGSAWITTDGRRLYMHHFGIVPEFQGIGLSKRLLKKTLQYAKDRGMQIKLEVHRDNETAKRIYLKGGFKYLGDYQVYIIRDTQSINIEE